MFPLSALTDFPRFVLFFRSSFFLQFSFLLSLVLLISPAYGGSSSSSSFSPSRPRAPLFLRHADSSLQNNRKSSDASLSFPLFSASSSLPSLASSLKQAPHLFFLSSCRPFSRSFSSSSTVTTSPSRQRKSRPKRSPLGSRALFGVSSASSSSVSSSCSPLDSAADGRPKGTCVSVKPPSSCFFSSLSPRCGLPLCGKEEVHSPALPRGSFSALYATKKGGGSSKNGRDSNPKFLGVKKFGGEFVLPGHILVRQRGSRYKAGDGVRLARDDSLTAVRSGFVDFNPVYKFEQNFKKRRWLQRHRRRVHAGYLVSVLERREDSPGYQKRQKLALLRTLSSAWLSGEVITSQLADSSSSSSLGPSSSTEEEEDNGMASFLSRSEEEGELKKT